MLVFERDVEGIKTELGNRVSAAVIGANVERLDQEKPRGHRHDGSTSMGMRSTTFRLLGGAKVKVTARYCLPVRGKHRGRRRAVGRHGQWGRGWYPALAQLGIQDGATPALASEVAWHAAEAASMEVAQQALARRGVKMDRKAIRRLAYRYGQRSLRLRDARIQAAGDRESVGPLAGKRVVASVDGGRCRVRSGEKRGRRRAKTRRRGYNAPWREPKVLTIYTIDERGRRDRRELPLHDGTMKDADAVFALIVGYLRLLGAADAAQLVLIGDGVRWIWDRLDRL